MSYLPDAGHAELIRLLSGDDRVQGISLTSEEEGIPVACGAWLAGRRSVLLMQPSGAGNCINALKALPPRDGALLKNRFGRHLWGSGSIDR